MQDRPFNVLFLCTGNFPEGRVHPVALAMLKQQKLPTENLRSKAWDEFAGPGAPHMDFVITVCDKAAGEVCPIWPGQPMTAHWGVADPAEAQGSDAEQWKAFFLAFRELSQRIRIFTSLPIRALENPRGCL